MSFQLEYCRSETYNFGDDLNMWLWPKLLGRLIDETSNNYFLGIGTILTEKRVNERLSRADSIVIFSSGAWEDNAPVLDSRCKVYGVRGPRTAQKLNLDSSYVVGDGAYLLREVEIPDSEVVTGRVGFIPHHRSEDYVNWDEICKAAGIEFISPKQPVEKFLSDIQKCERVVTEAMHGAIVADALRISWLGVRFSPSFNDEKWYDFAESMDIKLALHSLPFMSQSHMKLGKLIENTGKKLLSGLNLTRSTKWQRVPVIYRVAKQKELDMLAMKLNSLARSSAYQLSSDEVVEKITERQRDKVKEIIADFT